MKNRIALAVAGLLALAFAPTTAKAAACPNGATNGYTINLPGGAQACVAAVVLGDGRIVQFTSPVDATGAAISPALASLQTAGNNTLASILAAQATAALQGTANTSLASILSSVQSGNTAQATAAAQATGNTSLGSIDAKTPALSVLPTLANQAAGNASLASIDGKTPASSTLPTLANQALTNTKLDTLIGQAAPVSVPGTSIASGVPVPAFQGVTGGVPVGVSFTSQPLPAGAATAANQNATAAGTSATSAQGMQGVTGGVPVSVDTIVKGGGTDVGGTITTASTAQTFIPANLSRRAWSLQNQSTGDLYVNCSTTATLDFHSLKVPAGALYESPTTHVGTGACTIIGATAGAGFYARQF